MQKLFKLPQTNQHDQWSIFLRTQVREAADIVQDVGCGQVPLHEDDQVQFPDVHDTRQRTQNADRRHHVARRHGRDDEEARARQLDRGQDVRLILAGQKSELNNPIYLNSPLNTKLTAWLHFFRPTSGYKNI